MTMQHESHPHDERLAALADADREATDDRALRDHVATCDRCRAVVDDLTLLRSALAELPDLTPSRPLRLLPPVPAPAVSRGGGLGWLRRLSAPAFVAGAVLILVGAVGSAGLSLNLGAASAGRPDDAQLGAAGASGAEPSAAQGEGFTDSSAPTPATPRMVFGSGAPGASSAEATAKESVRESEDAGTPIVVGGPSDPFNGRLPWLVILGFGLVLAVGSVFLRFTVQPRAG
jgi:hypothetical protein